MADSDSSDHGDVYKLDPCECQLDEQISSGSTAEVYRGTFHGEPVAVKRIFVTTRKSLAHVNKQLQQAFEREITILQSAVHKNLVRMLGITLKPLQIVMELCEGGSCFDLIHNPSELCSHSWHQAIKIALDVADAMCYLHQLEPPIIHRDLKSSNILLVEPVTNRAHVPYAKVADFGLARWFSNDEKVKMTMDVGTFNWMAPEVLMETTYDEKVDVYSFGMILFELICSDVPFSELEAHEAASRAINGRRPDLSKLSSTCPEKLRMLMTTCWKQEPEKRPSFENVVKWLKLVGAELGFNIDCPGRIAQL